MSPDSDSQTARAIGSDVVTWATIKSRIGVIRVAATPRGVCKIALGRETAQDFRGWLERHVGYLPRRPDHSGLVALALDQIAEYLTGRRREFDLPLDVRGTDFQRRAWAAADADLFSGRAGHWPTGGSAGGRRGQRREPAAARRPVPSRPRLRRQPHGLWRRAGRQAQTVGHGESIASLAQPACRVFGQPVWLFDLWFPDDPLAFQAKLIRRQLKMTHGDAHIYALQICQPQELEGEAIAIPPGSLQVKVPGISILDDSPWLLV